MKKIFKWIIPALASCLFLWGFVHACTYDSMTHLNDGELEWITNSQVGEFIYFKSNDGEFDTVQITWIIIENTLDPIKWSAFNTSFGGDYIAYAGVAFNIRGKHEYIEITKWKGGTIGFSLPVKNRRLENVPLNPVSLQVDGTTINDVMIFDGFHYDTIDQDDASRIISYAWSKKYGLVQYTLADGTVFNRIELNDDNLKKTRWFPLNS
ncbi:MAG: hypothetical protein K2N16_05855 [Muribaculaceae bacterium]|nr:hypothetical protein [Muribaculaceae bacterium]